MFNKNTIDAIYSATTKERLLAALHYQDVAIGYNQIVIEPLDLNPLYDDEDLNLGTLIYQVEDNQVRHVSKQAIARFSLAELRAILEVGEILQSVITRTTDPHYYDSENNLFKPTDF